MKNRTTTFENRLLSYSLAAGAVLAGTGDLQAQINGAEVNALVTKTTPYSVKFNGTNVNFTFSLTTGGVGKLAGSFNARLKNGVSALPANNIITPYDNFPPSLSGSCIWNFNPSAANPFFGQGDKYLGVRFYVPGFICCGWIRINMPTNFAQNGYTVKAYAYNTRHYNPITTNDSVLPVELTSFNAAVDGSSVGLKWNTATEVNNHGFEIERSVGANWEKIGFVEGHGNSNSPLDYSYSDTKAPKGNLSYRLKQIDIDGKYTYSNEVEVANTAVEKFEMAQNYPNPFNPSTKIKFSLPEGGLVSLKVYNSLGQEVSTLVNKELEAGSHEAVFNVAGLPSGVYVYKISAGKYSAVKKMLMIK